MMEATTTAVDPDIHVLTVNLYISNSPWTDTIADHSSTVYTEIKAQLERDFSGLGGQLRTLELADNYGCIHIFVEWEATQPDQIIELTNRVTATGLTVRNLPVSVTMHACSADSIEPVMHVESFYISPPENGNLIALRSVLLSRVKRMLSSLGGRLSALIMKGGGRRCVEVEVRWTSRSRSGSLVDLVMDADIRVDGETVRPSRDKCDTDDVDVCRLPPQNDASCGEGLPRYFYNATSQMCEKFTGCRTEMNSFETLMSCCKACSVEGRCKSGTCPAVRPGAVLSCQDQCSTDSNCPGSHICCSNGCAKTCVPPQLEMPSDCWERRLEARKRQSATMMSLEGRCSALNIPECDTSGYWARQQCNTAYGLCWCVSPMGNFVNNTMTRGPAPCDTLTDLDMASADEMEVDPSTAQPEVCPGNEGPHCCPQSLCERQCRAHPQASCRINPCGGCKAEYFMDGEQVDCAQGLSKCQQELRKAETAEQEREITMRRVSMARGNVDGMEETSHQRVPQGTEMRCQLPPETGPCEGFSRMWYYNSTVGACSMFIWGLCEGNQNRFDSPAQCYRACDMSADPCQNQVCPAGEVCQHEYDSECYNSDGLCEVRTVCTAVETTSYAAGVFTPTCESSGEYSYKQCHGRYCWCVDQDGDYIGGLTTNTSMLECTVEGMTANSDLTIETCPNGLQPNVTCVRECDHRVCPGNPQAVCTVDLCAGDCAVTLRDDEDMTEISCTGNKCDVFKFDEDRQECSAKLECNGNPVRHCPASICQSASCPQNPCAVCNVDPCNCQPYFVDSTDGERLSVDQCRYVSIGACQAKTCRILNDRATARLRGESDNTTLPDCDEEGGFKPEQCNGEDCECVDEFGQTLPGTTDGACQEIDEIVEIEVVLTFFGTLGDIMDIIEDFLNAILERLSELGINPNNVRLGEPYEGSIKVDVKIVGNSSQPQQSRQNLALAGNTLRQAVETGNIDVNVGEQRFDLDPGQTVVTPRTASQVASEVTTEPSPVDPPVTRRPVDDDSGLSDTDKIIIICVCVGVSGLIIVIATYCICSRERNKRKNSQNIESMYDHIEPSKASLERDPVYDKPSVYA